MRAWCPSAGAGLAAAAIAEDLIDEYRLFVNPVILGGGTPYFTPLTEPLDLRLTASRTFTSGVVYLRYQRIDELGAEEHVRFHVVERPVSQRSTKFL